MSAESLPASITVVHIPEAGDGVECRLVADCPGYAVGSDGSFWSRQNNRWGLTNKWSRLTGTNNKGYIAVTLCSDGMQRPALLHRLVLEAFDGPCPDGLETRHFPDRDRRNNNLSNISYGTGIQNWEDRYVHGTDQCGEKNHQAKLNAESVVRIRELYATGMYLHKEIAKMFGVTRKAICLITCGKRWRHIGGPITDACDRRYRFNSETARRAHTFRKGGR